MNTADVIDDLEAVQVLIAVVKRRGVGVYLDAAAVLLSTVIRELQPPLPSEPPQPPPTESHNGEVECVCPRVRSGERKYSRCWYINCRCNADCPVHCECYAEHQRARLAAR